MQVVVRPYRLLFHRPLRTGATLAVAREGHWLQLQWPGVVGFGEAAGWPGFGAGTAIVGAMAAEVTRALALADVPPPPIERSAGRAWVAHSAERLCASAGTPPREWQHAIETALWDAAARAASLPLAAMLVDTPAAAVPLHVQVQSASQARAAVQGGATAIKYKVGHRHVDDDGAHVAGVRAAIGDAVGLRLDANGAWPGTQAARAARMLAAVAPEWLEQPLPGDDVAGMAALRREGAVPVAVDEGLKSPEALQAHLDAQAADVYVLKPLFLGGPRATLLAAERIIAAGKDVCVTHAMETRVGCQAALHVAAALLGSQPLQHVRAAGLAPMLHDADPHAPWPLTQLAIGTTPGLGVDAWTH